MPRASVRRIGTAKAKAESANILRELRLHQLELEAQNRQLSEAQALLEESRASYVELYDFAPVGYATLDRRGVVQQINLTGAALVKADRVEIVGQPFRSFFSPGQRSAIDAHVRRCFLGASNLVLELPRRDGDGFLEMTSGLRLGPGTTAVIHVIVTDISERRQMDAQRSSLLARERKARELAETASRVREEFFAVVSHELRTPLAPMALWVELLRHQIATPNADRLRQAVDALDQCVSAQRSLIDDLLEVARNKVGQQRLHRRPIHLGPIVESVVTTMKPAAEASKITLRVVLPATAHRPIMGDRDRLQQVVGNLISNAIKFTPEAGTVTVRLTRDAQSEILAVEDDGRGIEPAFLPHVFEAFRQQDSTSSRGCGGLGLGLSIARELVLLHGGTIQATSDGAGKGAKFIVSLPVSLGNSIAVEKPRLAGLSGVPAPSSLSRLKLLVIEDDEHTRLALRLALEQCGAQITAASSAPEGKEILDRFSPDVILCDIAMPGEDGYSFIRWLRERERGDPHRIPTLALTAHNSAQDRQKALASGFDLHVSKPLKIEELAKAVLFAVEPKRESATGARPTRHSVRRTAAAS